MQNTFKCICSLWLLTVFQKQFLCIIVSWILPFLIIMGFCFQGLCCSFCFWIIIHIILKIILNIISYRLKNLVTVENPIIILQDLVILHFIAFSCICKFFLASNQHTHWCYYWHLGKSPPIKTPKKGSNHTL